MAYLVERRGWYYIAFADPTGGRERRLSLKTRDRADAEEIIKDYNASERLGLIGLSSRATVKNPFLSELFDEYLIYSKQHKSPRSYRDDSDYIRRVLRPVFGHLRALDLTNKHIEELVGMMKNWRNPQGMPTPYHPRTINIRLQCLRAILRRAYRNRDIAELPVSIRLLRCPRSLPKYVTPADFAKWSAMIERPLNRHRAVVSLCTGISDRDLGRLTWPANYDKTLGIIKYRRQKTGKEIVIKLNEWARESMQWLLDHRKGPYIFQGILSCRKAYMVASARSGIHVTPHMLRHSFATWALSAGEPIERVSAILGHESVSTTQIYAHVMPQFLEETTGAIDRMRAMDVPRQEAKKAISGKICTRSRK